jgi:hypothetical protein
VDSTQTVGLSGPARQQTLGCAKPGLQAGTLPASVAMATARQPAASLAHVLVTSASLV